MPHYNIMVKKGASSESVKQVYKRLCNKDMGEEPASLSPLHNSPHRSPARSPDAAVVAAAAAEKVLSKHDVSQRVYTIHSLMSLYDCSANSRYIFE